MTYKEVYTMVDSIGLPSAYYQFEKETAKPPPFICFYFPSSDDFLADNLNYQHIRPLTIELYTDAKDYEQEAAVETALNANALVYSRDETYIEDEQMYLVTYYTEVIING